MINDLAEQNAILLKVLKDYHEIISALKDSKIPEIFKEKGGKVILNFSKGSVLINITLDNFKVWERKKTEGA